MDIRHKIHGDVENGFIVEIHDGERHDVHVGHFDNADGALDAAVAHWNETKHEGAEDLRADDLRNASGFNAFVADVEHPVMSGDAVPTKS